MASTDLSGATEVVIDTAGSSFTSGSEQTIDGDYIHGDTAFEPDDPNTPENPKGGQLWGGQLGTVIIHTSDQDVKSQLETWRTGDTNVDVRVKKPDGAGGSTNFDFLDCSWLMLQNSGLEFTEHGSVDTFQAHVRAYSDSGLLG